MTLKELLLKYEFDTVVPDLLTIDEPIKDNLYAFKEAFDTLRRMTPGDAGGEQIVVSLEVETEEDGTEVERYLYASNCEGDLWESSLAKEVVIEASEGQSNGVSRAHAKASSIKLVEDPDATAIDIRADYVAKNGVPNASAPKIFFRYYYVNSSAGEKSGTMLAEVKWAAAAAGGGEP